MIVHETRIKAARIKQEEDQRCPKTKRSSWTEFIFFRGKTFIHTKDSNELAEYEKEKKKKKKRAEEKALLTRPSHASPSHLHYSIQHPCLFFESLFFRRRPCFPFHCFFAGLCSLRGAEDGTSRACNLISVKTKISIPRRKGAFVSFYL